MRMSMIEDATAKARCGAIPCPGVLISVHVALCSCLVLGGCDIGAERTMSITPPALVVPENTPRLDFADEDELFLSCRYRGPWVNSSYLELKRVRGVTTLSWKRPGWGFTCGDASDPITVSMIVSRERSARFWEAIAMKTWGRYPCFSG